MPATLKDIYNALKGDGQFSQTKDYGTFEKRMNERGYSKMIYDNLRSAGATLPDIGTFRKKLGVKDWSSAPAANRKPAANTSSPAAPSARGTQPMYEDYANRHGDFDPTTSYQGDGVKAKYRYPGISEPTGGDYEMPHARNESALVRGLRRREESEREYNNATKWLDPSVPVVKKMKADRDRDELYLGNVGREAVEEGGQPAYDLGDEAATKYLSKRKSEVAEIHERARKSAESVWDKAMSEAGNEFSNYLKDRRAFSVQNVLRDLASGSNAANVGSENAEIGTEAFATHLKHTDMERLSDAAWMALGVDGRRALANELSVGLREEYPDATAEEIGAASMQMARAESDRRMYETAVAKNAPKSVAEFFMRRAALGTSIGKMMEASARVKAGTRGDMLARDEADAKYEQDGHKIAGTMGTVASFAMDPLTIASGGAGSLVAKGGTALGGKLIGQAAMRRFGTTLGGKVLSSVLGGMGNLGTLEAGSELAEQMRTGGWRDDEGNLHEGFSGKKVLGQGAHGAGMGMLTGALSPVIGNVSDRMVRATNSTAGKIGIRAGEIGAGTVAEGTIFSVPEWIEGDRDKMDVWTDNMAMMVGMKLQHGIKSAPKVIAELRGSGSRERRGFVERLHGVLDGNRQDLALTKDEKKELERGGYTDLKDLTDDVARHYAQRKGAKPTVTDAGKMLEFGDKPGDVTWDIPYNRFEELMTDTNISEAARAKMYYYLTGRMLPMSTVVGGNMTEMRDAEGKVSGYTVESFGHNGVVTRRHYADRKSADREMERVRRQAEINSLDVGERYYNAKNRDEGEEDPSALLRADILDETGVDVDKAVKKAFNERTPDEQTTIEMYTKLLYENVEREAADPFSTAQAEREAADIVDGAGLGTESPQSEAVQATMDELRRAQGEWTDAMRADESLAEGFKAAQEKGMGLTEAYGWMMENGYGTEESLAPLADVVTATVRAQAVYHGTQAKIEETVKEHVSTWQWEGTDFGQGEMQEPVMLYVTGADGHRLMVKSGGIRFDERGRAVAGDMLICLDLETNKMEYLSVKDVTFDGYESAKDYAEKYRVKLQEINSEGYGKPEEPMDGTEEPTADVLRESSKEAFDEAMRGKNGVTLPKDAIDNVQEHNRQMLEQERQRREEEEQRRRMDESNRAMEGNTPAIDQPTEEPTGDYSKDAVPLDKDGEPLYESVPKERTVEDLLGKLGDGGLAKEFATQRLAEAEKNLKAVTGKAPKMGTKVNEYLRLKAEYEAKAGEAQASVDYWNGVKEDIERLTHTTKEELEEQRRELDGTAAREELAANRESDIPDSAVAFAASVLADAKITPESLKAETGYKAQDYKKFVGMIAKAEKGGTTIARLAERLVEIDEENYGNMFFGGDDQAARSAILDALGTAKTRGELRDLARPDEAKAIREREEERDRVFYERYGMGYEEYLDYAEQEMVHLVGDMSNFDEGKYLQEHAVEITNQIDKEYGKGIEGHESAGEEPLHGAGSEVLSGEGSDDRGGSGPVAGHGKGKAEVRGGDHPNAALEEKASGGVGIDWSTYDKAPKNEAETKRETNNNEPRLQKVGGEADPVSHNERVLRDALDDHLRKSGMEVIGTDEGQRVLDMANGEDVRMSAKKRRALETVSVSRSEEHPQTVISSADGTKVLNNLDTLAKNYENATETKEKTFIGEVAKSLGMTDRGKSSQYATFETKNGKIVTIRLSNHNATVSNFDNNGETDGISIVVSAKKNEGVYNDGNAHITEYYYDAIKLRRAEGKPLADIVRSIKQTLYSGEFKDTTGLAERQDVNADEAVRLQKVYHGSGDDAGQPRFFRTANGEAYGFTVGGRIYYDPRIATSETLVHEYAHLWASALRGGNAEEWKNVVGLMKGTSVWDEVKRLYPELKTDDEIAEEVIAQYSGRRGAERLRKEAEKIADGDVYGKAEAISAMEKIRRALSKFWKGVCDMLHIHYTSAEEVADRVMKDLLDGVDPRKFGETDGKTLLDVDGKPAIVKHDDGKIEMNYRTWKDGDKEKMRDILINDAGLDPDDVDALIAQADSVADGIQSSMGKYPQFGLMQNREASKRPFVRDTGEYLSIDYSYNCVKKDAINSVIDALVEAGKGGHLGVTQIEALKKILQKHGFLTPCIMCYVEAKRKILKQSKRDEQIWNAVREAVGLEDKLMGEPTELTAKQQAVLKELTEGKGLERVANYTTKDGEGIKADSIKKIAALMLGNDLLRGNINYEWFMSPSAFTSFYDKFGDTGIVEYLSQGQYRGKQLFDAVPFNIDGIPRDIYLKLYSQVELRERGGVRQFSYEDARAMMFFDYYTQFLLLQGARAPMQLYTKRPFMPEMFGRSGAKMNQSLIVDVWRGSDDHRKALGMDKAEYDQWLRQNAGFIPKGALPESDARYEKGSNELVPAWSVESFPVDIAMKNAHNPDFRGHVGNVVVAPSVEFIKWALDNPDIHQILAYHANGANPIMKSLTGYDMATPMDDGYHTLDENGKAISELHVNDIGLHITGRVLQFNSLVRRNGGDARRAAKAYLDYCKEHGLTPMFNFEGVVDHKNYFKLLTDFRMYDESGKAVVQPAVKATLPENWKEILEKYLREEQHNSNKVSHIALSDELMKEINAATKYTSIETEERETLTKLLSEIYGKGNVQVLSTEEFDKQLDNDTEQGRAQMLRDSGGMVYGYAVGDRIVLNESVFNANTPMHEHTHIWMKVVEAYNPKLYTRGMDLWRATPMWEEVRQDLEALGEEATDRQIFSECISRFSGAENEKIISKVTGVTDKKWLEKAATWLREMWASLKSAFTKWTGKDLDNLTAEQFGRMPLRSIYDKAERKKYAQMVKALRDVGGFEMNAEMMHEGRDELRTANERFNNDLTRYQHGEMDKNEMLHLGKPQGVMRAFLPDLPIVMRQRVIKKGSEKKHEVDVSAIMNMPQHLSSPIFVFQRSEDTIGVLTDMRDRNGKNVCVAIELKRQIQQGAEYLEVNDVRSFHGREFKNIVEPIAKNKTLKWVDKEKGLAYLSSASQPVQQEIDKQDLDTATKVVKDFENPKVSAENVSEEGVKFRDGDSPVEKHITEVSKKVGGKVKMVGSVDEIDNARVRADIESGKKVRGWYDEQTGETCVYLPNVKDTYTAEKVVWHETVGHKGMRGLLGDKGYRDWLKGLWYDLDNAVNADLREYVRDRMAKEGLTMYDAIEEYVADAAEKGKGEPGFWNNVRNRVTDAMREAGYRMSPNVKDVQYMLWLAKNVQKHPDDAAWKMRAEAARWKIDHRDIHLSEVRGGEIADADGRVMDWDDKIDEDMKGRVHFSTSPAAATEIDQYNRAVGCKKAMLKESYLDSMNSVMELMKVLIPDMKRVEDVRPMMNPLMAENLMASQISARGRKFVNQEMSRLTQAYCNVLDAFDGKNTVERMRSANLYMIEKHGLERNRVFYVRDYIDKMRRKGDAQGADILQRQWNAEKRDLGEKLRLGKINLFEYYRDMDEWIRLYVNAKYKAENHDYSGMHGLQDIDARDPYDDAGAIGDVVAAEVCMESNKAGSVRELWDSVKEATNYSIHEEYRTGYVSKDGYERLRDMFDWYVPLRRYDEQVMEDMYSYLTGNVNASNSIGLTIQKAKGRKSLSDVNVLAQIGAMADGSIYRGGGNIMRQAFARMVNEYEKAPKGERVVTEIKGWAVRSVDANGNEIWTEVRPPIPADDTDQVSIMQAYDAWEKQMEAKKLQGDAMETTTRDNIPYKFLPKSDRCQHIVSVWIGGRRHDYLINGNPRAAQALNGLLRNETSASALAAVNRFLAQSVTSWNPEFMLRNTIRDFGFASHLLEAKEGIAYWSKFEKHFFAMGLAPAGRTITAKSLRDVKNGLFVSLFKRYEQGTLDYSKPYHEWFAEFMETGGMTGIVTNKSLDKWKKMLKGDVKKMREGMVKNPSLLWKTLFGCIENANEMCENITRFATYCASRESGRTKARSAYDAHEVSVNFNRRGSGNAVKTYAYEGMGKGAEILRDATGFFAGWMRNYTMFFNASVQSFSAFAKNVKAHPIRSTAVLMALPFGVAALMPWLNKWLQSMLDDDEDRKNKQIPADAYAELPDFIRRNNLCIYRGGGEFVTIPLSIETRAFYGLGDLSSGYTFTPELQSQKNVAIDIAGQLSQIVPVGDFMSGSSFGTNMKADAVAVANKFVPSSFSPLVELMFNVDWKGTPIMRDGDYLDNSPSWMRAPRGTFGPLVDLNKWVNAETNDIQRGNENMKGSEVLDWMTNPAAIEHLYDSYVGGAGTFAKRVARVGKRAYNEIRGKHEDIEARDVPFVRSLLYSPTEQTAMARTKAKWYRYREDIEKDAANMKVLTHKDVPMDERLRNIAELHKLQHNVNARRVAIYQRAEKLMKAWKKRKARAQSDEMSRYADEQINMIMSDAVKAMDAIK